MPLPLLAVALALVIQSASTPASPIAVVKRFYDAYQRLDVEGMTAVMAPDMVFDDPTFRLKANSRAEWRKQAEANLPVIARIGAEIHSTVQSGDTVAVEVTLSGGIKAKDRVRDFKVRCASFFSVHNSLITRWADYCDYRTFTEQTSPAPAAPFAMSGTEVFEMSAGSGPTSVRSPLVR